MRGIATDDHPPPPLLISGGCGRGGIAILGAGAAVVVVNVPVVWRRSEKGVKVGGGEQGVQILSFCTEDSIVFVVGSEVVLIGATCTDGVPAGARVEVRDWVISLDC